MSDPRLREVREAVDRSISAENDRIMADPKTWESLVSEPEAAVKAAKRYNPTWDAMNAHLLNLTNCSLHSLPPEMSRLVDLQVLYLRGNQLRALPRWMANFDNLYTLDISGNPALGHPQQLLESGKAGETKGVLASLRNLRELYVDANYLASQSTDFREHKLKSLVVFCDEMTEKLPDAIWGMVTLVNLQIHNSRVELPVELGNLKMLVMLDFFSCHMRELPTAISEIPKLETIRCFDCPELCVIPPEIGECAALDHLAFTRCWSVTSLPEEIGNCSALQTLYAEEASINELPVQLSDCKKLRYVSVGQLSAIPLALGLLPNLSELRIAKGDEMILGQFRATVNVIDEIKERARVELGGRLTKRADPNRGAATAGKSE